MPDAFFAIPGDLDTPTGGYAYARRLLELLPTQGVSVRHLPLPSGYPAPSEGDLARTAELVAGTDPGAALLLDGLAYGAMPEELIRGFGRPIVALVHHPLGLESGLTEARSRTLIESEIRALALASRVIVTSPLTGRQLAADFGVPAERITVAEPGTEPAPRARGTGSPVALLSVGAVSPRKGYDVLVRALSDLRRLDWRATIAGAANRAPEVTATLRAAIDEAGLAGRVRLAGAVTDTELAALYDAADLFVSPSLYEGYGMVLAEAMVRGLPMVASTGGAAAETVPDEAGLKVPPGDATALAGALRQAIADAGLRASLAEASWRAGQHLPSWADTAARVAKVLREAAR